ncbi:oxygenase MpaB family protein [Mycobacteroides immunogenum]|uniref:oxygenase MpaB family protein n=1 Tax=Mycobacteroides immunogenum TaxID=83262 RepID=UPI0025B77FE1|nr:oxygenase MpaB family protein [Mycobacteroides immunogenum]WJR35912.1 oxygenase MpaB family protein [Mycobacteroides immunogenum]
MTSTADVQPCTVLRAPTLPNRYTLGNEAFTHLLNYLIPEGFDEFLRVDAQVADHYFQAMYLRDETADSLTRVIRQKRGPAREQFEQAVECGIDTVIDPLPEVVAFFETVDDVPPGIDMELVEEGARVLRRIDPITFFGSAWSTGFLIGAILPNVAEALVMKKRTIEDAGNRLTETGAYVRSTYERGGLGRFGNGTKSALRLRLLHSGIRLSALDSGRWNEVDHGTPSSVVDTIGGALPHSWWTMTGAQNAGYRFSDHEQIAVAEFAACALFRHGIPENYVMRTPSEFRSYTYLALRSANAFAADQATATLIPPMTNVQLAWLPPHLRPVVTQAFNAYAHRVLGDGLCEAHGIPDTRLKYLIPVLNFIVGTQDRLRRHIAPLNSLHNAVSDWLWDDYFAKILRIASVASHYHALSSEQKL